MKIGITGADGMLGYHLRAFLHARGDRDVKLATRQTFADPGTLDSFCRELEGLIHLAGMNRGGDAEVEATNLALAETLVGALMRTGARPALVYANSTHSERDTNYGRGKRAAGERLAAWAANTGATFADLVLPNVFGEFGKPFYNSVVATFCHQIAVGETPHVHADAVLELIHAQAVVRRCREALSNRESGRVRVTGTPLRVSALLDRLRALHARYAAQVIPDLRDLLDLDLFNTLRSYLFPRHYPVSVELRTDTRGSLFEAVRTHNSGQTFLSTTYPRVTRGNHYHLRKVERFLVVSGNAEIRLRRLFCDHVDTFSVSGAAPCYVDMPTFYSHSITNVGEGDVVTMFWSNEIFDPTNSDTYPELVLQ